MPDFNFSEFVERAMLKPSLQGSRHVVEKELLHYDILFTLEREGCLNSLVFHGGPAFVFATTHLDSAKISISQGQ